MQTLFATTIISTFLFATVAVAQDETPPADTSVVSKLAEQICPAESEMKWLKIPWRVSFWQGVQDSQVHAKPILLWAMNGHPLGCT